MQLLQISLPFLCLISDRGMDKVQKQIREERGAIMEAGNSYGEPTLTLLTPGCNFFPFQVAIIIIKDFISSKTVC